MGLEWEIAMKDPNADLNFIKNQVESCVIAIDKTQGNPPNVVTEKSRALVAAIIQFGHLVRLNPPDQDKVIKIMNWLKKQVFHSDNF